MGLFTIINKLFTTNVLLSHAVGNYVRKDVDFDVVSNLICEIVFYIVYEFRIFNRGQFFFKFIIIPTFFYAYIVRIMTCKSEFIFYVEIAVINFVTYIRTYPNRISDF